MVRQRGPYVNGRAGPNMPNGGMVSDRITVSARGVSPMQPVALAVRFLLELLGLAALGLGGYHAAEAEVARWLLALAIPTFAAAIWGVFRIPDDPKPAPVAVPGPVRLLIEACFFGGATVALVATAHPALAAAFGGAVLVDYALLPARARRLARWR